MLEKLQLLYFLCCGYNGYNQQMGNHNHHNRSSENKKNNVVVTANNHMKCPRCNFVMPPNSTVTDFANHVRNCYNEHNQHLPNHIKNHPLVQKGIPSQYEKVPVDYTMTKFKWEKKYLMAIDPKIATLTNISDVKKLSFQEKEFWFRSNLERYRISWEKGADWMKLERSNILMSSLNEYRKINMHKQVKIQFLGEKVNDAGGLLREWIHMVIKQVFDDATGIFIPGNCEDIVYKLKWDEDLDEQFSTELFLIFGTILGKAIFQKIPVLCYIDRTILRQICQDPVKIEDIYWYDSDLYKNWTYILEADNVEDMDIYFSIQKNNGDTIQEIQLIQNGKDTIVNNKNKFKYIDLCIETQTTKKVERSLTAIKNGISKVIPFGLLNVFQPYELEMILYGVPFIDIKQWRENTIYKQPYAENHKVIIWFWKVMEEFDQEQLSNILHFCTGSSRTPIHGFKKLQSNRGNYSKFLIESAPYQTKNPYPKGHTCFNRLQLPLYPSFDSLLMYLTAISKNNLDGVFGLD